MRWQLHVDLWEPLTKDGFTIYEGISLCDWECCLLSERLVILFLSEKLHVKCLAWCLVLRGPSGLFRGILWRWRERFETVRATLRALDLIDFPPFSFPKWRAGKNPLLVGSTFFKKKVLVVPSFPPPGDLAASGMEPRSPEVADGFFTAVSPRKPMSVRINSYSCVSLNLCVT